MGGVKMKKIRTTISLCLLGISLISCTKEWNDISGAGHPVRFGASTQYRNAPGTRTEYSGVVTNGIERIDWLTSDKIRVYSPDVTRSFVKGGDEHWADYQISGFGSDHSIATLKNVQPNGLAWPDNNSHTFYSIYPSPETDEGKATNLPGMQGVFSGTIPATQVMTWSGEDSNARVGKPDMDLAYMFARRTSRPSAGNTELDFKPMINTFMFTLTAEQEMTVNSFELISSTCALTGDFSVKVTEDTEVDVLARTAVADSDITRPAFEEGTNNKVTVDLGGATISPEKSVTFTVFAIPQEITNLTIQLNTTGGVKKLKLNDKNGNSVKFPTFLKANINGKTTPNEWEYILEFVDGTVMVTLGDGTQAALMERSMHTEGLSTLAIFDSYRNKTDGSVSYDPVSVQLEYALPDANGEPGAWSTSFPAGLIDFPVNAIGAFRSGIVAQLNENTEIARRESRLIDHARILKANAPVSDLDLSLYDIDNLTSPRSSGKPSTANSYVVDRPGTFRFPLVYGNAVDWTMEMVTGCNVRAYSNGKAEDTLTESGNMSILSKFPNARGNGISSPYILKDLGLTVDDVEAVVLWEDVESEEYSMLKVNGIEEFPSTLFKDVDGSDLLSVPYIKFEVPVGSIIEDESMEPEKRVTGIRQGNVLIGLREKSTGDFLWSWHIWLTDFSMEPHWMREGDPSYSYYNSFHHATTFNDVLANDLGWCDTRQMIYYRERVWFVRISQAEGSATPIICKIIQPAHREAIGGSTGTLYQYGRKDPFLPLDVASDTYSKPAYSPMALLEGGQHYSDINNTGIAKAIKNPAVVYSDEVAGRYCKWFRITGEPYANLWNVSDEVTLYSIIEGGGRDYTYHVIKSVFDPCPPGFSVPNPAFMSNAVKLFRRNYNYTDYSARAFPHWRVADINQDGVATMMWDVLPESGISFFVGENEDEELFFPLLKGDIRRDVDGKAKKYYEYNSRNEWLTSSTNLDLGLTFSIELSHLDQIVDQYIDGIYIDGSFDSLERLFNWWEYKYNHPTVSFEEFLVSVYRQGYDFYDGGTSGTRLEKSNIEWAYPCRIRPVREKALRGISSGEMGGTTVNIYPELSDPNKPNGDWTVINN